MLGLWEVSDAIELFTKKPFLFNVGPDRMPLYCNRDIFKATSAPLHAMITGSMKEGTKGEAELPDVKPSVFAAVLEYLYKGDYCTSIRRIERPTQSLRFEIGRNAWSNANEWLMNDSWAEFNDLDDANFKRWDFYSELVRDEIVNEQVDSFTILLYCDIATFANKYLMCILEAQTVRLIYDSLHELSGVPGKVDTVYDKVDTCNIMLNILDGILNHQETLESVREMIYTWFAGAAENFSFLDAFEELLGESHEFSMHLCKITTQYLTSRNGGAGEIILTGATGRKRRRSEVSTSSDEE